MVLAAGQVSLQTLCHLSLPALCVNSTALQSLLARWFAHGPSRVNGPAVLHAGFLARKPADCVEVWVIRVVSSGNSSLSFSRKNALGHCLIFSASFFDWTKERSL